MPTKDEYKRVFNAIFGVDIAWDKLTKEELAQLAAVLANPDTLIAKLRNESQSIIIKSEDINSVLSAIDEAIADRPLLRILRKVM